MKAPPETTTALAPLVSAAPESRRAAFRAPARIRWAAIAAASFVLLAGCGGGDALPDPAADLPAADSEYLTVTNRQLPIDGETVDVDLDHQLTIPSGTLTLRTAGTLASVPADLLGPDRSSPSGSGPSDLRPADGHHFQAAAFLVENDPDAAAPSSEPAVSVAVEGETVGDLTDVYVGGRAEGIIIVSVADDAEEISLLVAFEGLTQSLDLRTGERTSTGAAAYYDGAANRIDPVDGNRIEVSASVPYTDYNGAAEQCAITTTGSVVTAYRVPWLTGSSWAPDGSSWVAVELDSFEVGDQCSGVVGYFSPADTEQMLSLVIGDGQPIPVTTADGDVYVFEAPEGAVEVSLRVTVSGEVGGSQTAAAPVLLDPVDIALSFA